MMNIQFQIIWKLLLETRYIFYWPSWFLRMYLECEWSTQYLGSIGRIKTSNYKSGIFSDTIIEFNKTLYINSNIKFEGDKNCFWMYSNESNLVLNC